MGGVSCLGVWRWVLILFWVELSCQKEGHIIWRVVCMERLRENSPSQKVLRVFMGDFCSWYITSMKYCTAVVVSFFFCGTAGRMIRTFLCLFYRKNGVYY